MQKIFNNQKFRDFEIARINQAVAKLSDNADYRENNENLGATQAELTQTLTDEQTEIFDFLSKYHERKRHLQTLQAYRAGLVDGFNLAAGE